MMTFDFTSEVATAKINPAIFKKAVLAFEAIIKSRKNLNFSLVIVDGRTVRKWNRVYRHQDKMTDVLSFAEADQFDFIDGSKENSYLGEVIICYGQAKRQARELGHSLTKELTRLMVHGLAHLLGYDHEKVPKIKVQAMVKLEESVMDHLNLD